MHYTFKQTQNLLQAFEDAVFAVNDTLAFEGKSQAFMMRSSLETTKRGTTFTLKAKFNNRVVASLAGNSWDGRITMKSGKNYTAYMSQKDSDMAVESFKKELRRIAA